MFLLGPNNCEESVDEAQFVALFVNGDCLLDGHHDSILSYLFQLQIFT